MKLAKVHLNSSLNKDDNFYYHHQYYYYSLIPHQGDRSLPHSPLHEAPQDCFCSRGWATTPREWSCATTITTTTFKFY